VNLEPDDRFEFAGHRATSSNDSRARQCA
jgi:hypothetical protein